MKRLELNPLYDRGFCTYNNRDYTFLTTSFTEMLNAREKKCIITNYATYIILFVREYAWKFRRCSPVLALFHLFRLREVESDVESTFSISVRITQDMITHRPLH